MNGWYLTGPDSQFAQETQARLDTLVALADKWSLDLGSRPSPTPAGYTYLGQFLAHELVSGMEDPASWQLDLRSVYSDSGTFGLEDGPLFKMRLDDQGRPFDLFRDKTRRAVIPEPRNDVHLLIAQFHLLIQRLHNAAVMRTPSKWSDAKRYERARRFVVQSFHNIVLHDFLPRFCDAHVLDLVRKGVRAFDMTSARDSLPFEVTHAAFRFGHSLILPSYETADQSAFTLAELMLLGQFRNPGGALPEPGHRVDWNRFFDHRVQETLTIDLSIVQDMRQAIPPSGLSIVGMNLESGIREELPRPGDVAAAVSARMGSEAGITVDLPLGRRAAAMLAAHDLAPADLPLWFFVLLEADQNARSDEPSAGGPFPSVPGTLGPLGSALLASALYAAVEAVKPEFETGNFALNPLSTMQEIVDFVEQQGDPSDNTSESEPRSTKMIRVADLKPFKTRDWITIESVGRDGVYIPANAPDRDEFIAYYPDVGDQIRITLNDDLNPTYAMVEHKEAGSKPKELLSRLRFMPSRHPTHPILKMKTLPMEQRRLGNSGWYLMFSTIEQRFGGVDLIADVRMYWHHESYDEMLVSWWKYSVER